MHRLPGHAAHSVAGTTWTIRKTDGTTKATKTVTASANAEQSWASGNSQAEIAIHERVFRRFSQELVSVGEAFAARRGGPYGSPRGNSPWPAPRREMSPLRRRGRRRDLKKTSTLSLDLRTTINPRTTAMASPNDIFGTVFKGGTATLLARIVGNGGVPVVQADIEQITYSIYLLDDDDADRRDAVAGTTPLTCTLPRSSSIDFKSICCGPSIRSATTSATCRTFSAAAAFPTAGRQYLLEYRLIRRPERSSWCDSA